MCVCVYGGGGGGGGGSIASHNIIFCDYQKLVFNSSLVNS